MIITLSILLIIFSSYIIYHNWKSFYVQTILDEPYSSVIPLLGGLSLFAASIMTLEGNLKYFSLFAFLIDYGSLTFILHSFLNQQNIQLYGLTIPLISRRKRNKQLIYKYLENFDNGRIEKLFYKIFEENNKASYISYELNNSHYLNSLFLPEINRLFSHFKSLKINNYYLSIANIEEIIFNNNNINGDNNTTIKKIKIGYFLSKDIDKKYLIICEKQLILDDWNLNIFTELICAILIKKYEKSSRSVKLITDLIEP